MKTTLKTFLVLGAFAGISSAAMGQVSFTINFDTEDNWIAGSGGITSYQDDHSYNEGNWSFTSDDSLRQTSADQGDVPGALDVYSWRVRGQTGDVWTATYDSTLPTGESFTEFSFQARRWSGDDPEFEVYYSFDGGTEYSQANDIGSVDFSDNEWVTFSQAIASPSGLSGGDFLVEIRSTTSANERFMVDQFSAMTAIPEPSTYAAIFAGLALGIVVWRRKFVRKDSCG
ncbi:MAG: PEP-CTERM sorting domain-containing protein [Opitutales bacterium]|nr:PEP-CTERM sorting domain-containing protein [Opitutales bacterium]